MACPFLRKKKQQKDLFRGRNFVPETQLRVWSCASRSTEEGSVFNVASRALLLQTASATKLKWTYRHCNMRRLREHIKGLVPTSPAGRPGSSINCCNIEQLLIMSTYCEMSNIFRKGQWIHLMLGITRCSVAISQPLHAKDFGSILVTCDQLILFPAKREYASKSVTWSFAWPVKTDNRSFGTTFFKLLDVVKTLV